ncbi:hypothetical protein TrST_g3951 [Triparma strigata]|uniref:Uncharacterized protein n=1 Tax=Triparma strigata TaxID=1606541 RepID=A0A9W6ZSX8_9STRA|nr:hypothetical protein TrST_g3951 [Triparma strigata]
MSSSLPPTKSQNRNGSLNAPPSQPILTHVEPPSDKPAASTASLTLDLESPTVVDIMTDSRFPSVGKPNPSDSETKGKKDVLEEAMELGLSTPLPDMMKSMGGSDPSAFMDDRLMKELDKGIKQLEEGMTMGNFPPLKTIDSGIQTQSTPTLPILSQHTIEAAQAQQKLAQVAAAADESSAAASGGKRRRSSFNGRRGSFSKLMGGLFGRGGDPDSITDPNKVTDDELEKIKARGAGAPRRRSWGEIFLGQEERKIREIHVEQKSLEKKRNPSLKEIKEKQKKEQKSGRGFRQSFTGTMHQLLGVEDFGPVGNQGKYPDKIVKRLKNEAKRYAVAKNLPESVLSLKPEDKRNKDGVNVFWLGEIAGPKGTIYDMSTIICELFVSPDYPFKGPTLQYEGHVVEFVAGKNQTDPREQNIQTPWTPAMTLADAVKRVEDLLLEQQKKIETEQKNMEMKRKEKARKEELQKELDKEMEKAKEAELEEGAHEDPTSPLYIPPFGTPSPKKEEKANNRTPMNTPPKQGSLDYNLATASSNFNDDTPSTKNPLADPMNTMGNIEIGDDHDVDIGVQEPLTPVVKLGKSSALPRRGSFRHSFSNKNDSGLSGLDVDKLLADEGVQNVLDSDTED